MKKIIIFTFFIFAIGFQSEQKATEFNIGLNEANAQSRAQPITIAECRRRLRRAGQLIRGRGANKINFERADACVRNGGRI